MKTRFLFLFSITILISACAGTQPAATPSPATLLPFPTVTATNTLPPPQLSTFPYAPTLNEALPKENLILAAHVYADAACYDVGIYADDSYTVISCLPDFTYPAPNGTLDTNESSYLQRWVHRFVSYEEPGPHGIIIFTGSGNVTPDFAEKLAIENLILALEYRAHAYTSGGGMPNAVTAARVVLSNEFGIFVDSIIVHKFESVDFPDTCLGAPKPDEVCESIITSGLRVLLIAEGMLYEYRTDFAGYDLRFFSGPQIAPTQGAGG